MDRAQANLLRRGRFSEPGRLYLLTTVTHARKPLFQDFRTARLVIRELSSRNAWVLAAQLPGC